MYTIHFRIMFFVVVLCMGQITANSSSSSNAHVMYCSPTVADTHSVSLLLRHVHGRRHRGGRRAARHAATKDIPHASAESLIEKRINGRIGYGTHNDHRLFDQVQRRPPRV